MTKIEISEVENASFQTNKVGDEYEENSGEDLGLLTVELITNEEALGNS